MIVELLQLSEAVLVATVVTIGTVATGAAVLTGEEPPNLKPVLELMAPPYESDEKRIYPDVWEDKEPLPVEERIDHE